MRQQYNIVLVRRLVMGWIPGLVPKSIHGLKKKKKLVMGWTGVGDVKGAFG